MPHTTFSITNLPNYNTANQTPKSRFINKCSSQGNYYFNEQDTENISINISMKFIKTKHQ